jgi:hypothetical protein
MKTRAIILLFISLFTSGCILIAKKQSNTMENIIPIALSKVNINNEKFDSLIAVIINENQNYLNDNDCFLLMEKVKGSNDTNYMNIVIYEKAKLTITCSNNDYSIWGYFEVNNQIVLVIGNLRFDKMQYLDEKKTFNFKCEKTWKEDGIVPPPSMYNPPFYTFLYEE